MWRKIVYASVIKSNIRVLTKPIVALVSFNVLFSLYHMPVIFDYSKSSQFAHTSTILVLLFFAFIMWWPIITPLEDRKSTRLNSSHVSISYAVFCLRKK